MKLRLRIGKETAKDLKWQCTFLMGITLLFFIVGLGHNFYAAIVAPNWNFNFDLFICGTATLALAAHYRIEWKEAEEEEKKHAKS